MKKMAGGATLNKKAFTLIELLAVIVILAIIALIATPIILGIINAARESATKRSADNYVKAVEQAVMRENLTGYFDPTTCQVSGATLSCTGYEPIQVDVEGEKPTTGTIIFANHRIDTYELVFGTQTVRKSDDGTVPSSTVETYTVYEDGRAVGFNVTTGEGCNVADAVSATGTKEGCMKFYAFNDSEDSSTVNLLLDHNTTDYIAWNYNMGWANDEEQGPLALLAQLHTDTDSWNGTETLEPKKYGYTNETGIKYNSAWGSAGIGYSYEIDYSGYKARLISADEIAKITSKDGWNSSTGSNFYFKDFDEDIWAYTGPKPGEFGWLYDRTDSCVDYGCYTNDSGTSGYWTSSAYSSYSNYACYVSYTGDLGSGNVNFDSRGLRPVITVLKSNLS